MTAPLRLADDQKFALMKLRRNVGDLLGEKPDDRYLVRWLKSRRWNVAEAEKALRTSLEWRKRFNVDKLLEWQPPEILDKYVPCTHCGYDKDGTVVLIVNVGNFDIYGMLHVVATQDFLRYVPRLLEGYLKLSEAQEAKHGPDASQITVIFNLENFDVKQYMNKMVADVCITLIRMYEAHYPEQLKNCYIINAPRVFAMVFAVVKRFLHENTLAKISIFTADPAKYQAAILKTVPKDQLPVYFGGTLADPDGNPRLTTKIHQGGKIPKDLYVKQADREPAMNDSTTVTVRKGDKLKLNFPATQAGSILSWEFRCEAHDIQFGVLRQEIDGRETPLVPLKRIPFQYESEIGTLPCDTSANYTVVFDNSYSLFRNKKLTYSVQMMPPPDNLEVATLEDS